VVGAPYVLVPGTALEPYMHDGTFMTAAPQVAVLPASTEEVAAVVRVCARAKTPVVARGAGTGLAGGPVPLGDCVVLSLERLLALEVDPANACATAGAGVITGGLQEAAAEHGLFYPPDPGSVMLSTIGGNVACNAGGMCCLKYGVTADYVIGMTVVLADGTVLRLGGKTRKRASGYRLAQLFTGSEGTLGIVTEVILKLIPLPRHRATAMVGYRSLDDAAQAVARIMGAGYLPAALELIDRTTLELVAEHLPPGFEPQLEAVLVLEQDGHDPAQVQGQLSEIVGLAQGVRAQLARSEAERAAIWKARREVGKVLLGRPRNFVAEDVGVPIAAIPEMVRRIRATAAESALQIIVFGHAGDGNLHPCFLFTEAERPRVGPAAARILRAAVELGGTISAEHGLGALKRDYAELEHGPETMALMRRIKRVLDPHGLLNPHKIFPEAPADAFFLDRQPGWHR
jgi:glycolate oxidase